ncbi:MAG: YkgJ family cysteine cluster protein, partial [Desulfuromonas sp.]|nr:YkgJ family cysteine cluster protein [Desulfuromonas sp.]
MTPLLNSLHHDYLQLLGEVDRWYQRCSDEHSEQLVCHIGCCGCCRGLFDITLLDAALLQQGFRQLPQGRQQQVLERCHHRLHSLQQRWPGVDAPYILNRLGDDSWQSMPEDDETPCPLLDEDGCCLVYAHRPMTC